MMQFDLEVIQKQHEDLLLQNERIGNDDISPITSFLESLAQAGADIQDSRYRAQLRALIRYWANIVNEKTGSLPLIQLQPFDEIKYALKHQQYTLPDHHTDWGEAPSRENFYGRGQELAKLEQLIVGDRCRLIAVLGVGGIGKTALTAQVAERIKDQFEYFFWRSLQNAPDLGSLLEEYLHFISEEKGKDLPEDVDGQIAQIIAFIQEHRCLIVLDNVESILQGGQSAGQYREGYEEYGRLLQLLGEVNHQSCLLLTSREKPREVARLEGSTLPVRSLQLQGIGELEGRLLLKDKGLFGSDESWNSLIQRYSGNPLALQLVSESIREVFGGDVTSFLKKGELVFGDIYDLLDEQFHRLSELEQGIMFWLAIEREVVSSEDLEEDLVHPVSRGDLLVALGSLRRRSMIEASSTAQFTLQSVIMEYVTNRFVEQVVREIETEAFKLFESHALIKAKAKDYIRGSQVRLILKPVADHLLMTLGKAISEKILKSFLSTLHELPRQTPTYGAGNILNLLIHLGCDLHRYNFSHLVVRQAYLQGAFLPEVNFAHADLSSSIFTETFGSILSIALSPNGELLAAGTANGEIIVWQTLSGRPILTCQGHTDWVWSVAFSPDGQVLASGSEDQTVRLWEVSTGQCLKTLQGHTDQIWSVAFSPDGQVLASGSSDQTVRLWEASTGQCLKILQGHTSWVWSVAFSPDGQVLASGSDDETIKLWEVQKGESKKSVRSERLYERMNITGVRGLTEVQKAMLKVLGAIEY